MCSDADAVFSDTPIFIRAVLIGTNSLSMSAVVTLNPSFCVKGLHICNTLDQLAGRAIVKGLCCCELDMPAD